MKNTILSASLLAVLLAGCSTDHTTQGPAPAAQQRVSTENATRVHGDVMPTRLVAVQLPKQEAIADLSASMPGQPKKAFTIEHVPDISTRREFARVITQADVNANSGALSFPIDSVHGARVVVSSRDAHGSIPLAHLRDSSGHRLDNARDPKSRVVMAQRSALVPNVAGKTKLELAPVTPPTKDPEHTRLVDTTPTDPSFETELGFSSLNVPRRILSIDVPAKAGRVSLELPKEALEQGVEIDVQLPNASITLAGAMREPNYAFGDVAEVEYTLADDGKPIDGASFVGTIELPNGERINGLTFESLGHGKYLGKVPLASADLKYIGVWHLRAKATGTSDGVEFERDIESGFGYAPAHARIVAVTTPEVVRGSDGKIDDIKIDVEVDSVIDDRLGVAGALVYKDATGEHSVALAQTSSDLHAGTSLVTLHFEAKDVALARTDGPFFVRDLSLVSHAYATTQHRIGRGLDLATTPILASEIRFPTEVSPAVDELFELGELERP